MCSVRVAPLSRWYGVEVRLLGSYGRKGARAVRGRGRPRREDYLTTTQAAVLAAEAGYPVSSKTVARLFDAGVLTGHRTEGGSRRILRDSLEAFLHSKLDTTDGVV